MNVTLQRWNGWSLERDVNGPFLMYEAVAALETEAATLREEVRQLLEQLSGVSATRETFASDQLENGAYFATRAGLLSERRQGRRAGARCIGA